MVQQCFRLCNKHADIYLLTNGPSKSASIHRMGKTFSTQQNIPKFSRKSSRASTTWEVFAFTEGLCQNGSQEVRRCESVE